METRSGQIRCICLDPDQDPVGSGVHILENMTDRRRANEPKNQSTDQQSDRRFRREVTLPITLQLFRAFIDPTVTIDLGPKLQPKARY